MMRSSLIRQARRRLVGWDHGAEAGPAWLEDITVIVTTFERPQCILRFLESVRRFYPRLRVLVCENSLGRIFEERREIGPRITWLPLPRGLDHTLGEARNYLLEHVETPFLFLADDDHEVTAHTDLARMHEFLVRTGYDIVGGCQGKNGYGTAIFKPDGNKLIQEICGFHEVLEDGVVRCDRVANSFLARTGAVRSVLWEPRVYYAEHTDFFLRATRQGLKIAQMAGVWVDHDLSIETTTFFGWLFSLGRANPHKDGRYYRLAINSDNWRGARSQRSWELIQKYVFAKNHVAAIVSKKDDDSQARLERALGYRAAADAQATAAPTSQRSYEVE